MPALREVLAEAYGAVSTYLQSGNVVLSSDDAPEDTRRRIAQLIEERFGFAVDVLIRTGDELAAVVERNPLGQVAENPKRYQVTFLEQELDAATLEKLASKALPDERFVAIGRELYAWHPDGVGRSKLWPALARQPSATARNWTTVTELLAMADQAA